MSLFKRSANTQAFLKAGLMGFAGSGKTYTAAQLAIGLQQLLVERNLAGPVNFLDTETGSDWVEPAFRERGIELNVAKTRAFTDLFPAVADTAKEGGILIIDSITHFWRELTESYAKKRHRTRGLEFQDWGYLKQRWGEFTDEFVNARCHIIMCGRAGFEYGFFVRDDGKREIEKTGVKMKAETETGYEPSILVLMERQQLLDGGKAVKAWRTATVLKDRANLLDGQSFDNPTFENFRPHIEFLNLGGTHLGVDTSRSSASSIDSPDSSGRYVAERCAILCDDIQGMLVKHYPGQSADAKKAKVELLQRFFGHTGWSGVQALPENDLRSGLGKMTVHLEGGDYVPTTDEQASSAF